MNRREVNLNILDLPDEMIAEILFYIPDQLLIGLTCKKFHEVSCYIKFFKLSLHRHFKINEFESESDDQEEEIFESMIISKRRVNCLSIGCWYDSHNKFKNVDCFLKIIEHFAKDIKQLELSCVELNHNFIDFLNMMPNLVKINLYKVSGDVNMSELRLKLHKLKEIQSSECPAEVLEVFNALPVGVLQKVELLWYPSGEIENFRQFNFKIFENQRNIKEITAHSYLNLINFRELKLHSLLYEDFSTFRIQENLQAQDKLTSLSSHSFQKGDLSFICGELKSLEFLHGSFYNISSSEFAELSKLKKLKNLRISWIAGGFVDDKVNESMFVMQSESLTDLEINCDKVMESAVAQLGVNCPNLQRFSFESKASFNVLNMIIKNYKNLRSLVFRGGPDENDRNYYGAEELGNDVYVFRQGLKHRKLQKLSISGWCEDYQDLPKLVACCTNLKTFKTTLQLNTRMLQKVLVSNSTLLKLHLTSEFNFLHPKPQHKISLELIEVLKNFGRILNYFYYEFNNFDDGLTPKILLEEFKNHYTVIEVSEDYRNFFKWEMQRSQIFANKISKTNL